jgi:TrmH family RNA methyltransferase
MQNSVLTSMQNPLIKEILLLQKKKSERRKQGLFIVEGIKAIQEIPKDYFVREYILSETFNKENFFIDSQKGRVCENNTKVVYVKESIFNAISDTETPQGIMAVVEQKTASLEDILAKEHSFGLVLENVQDPGNLGTIIRSAYGFKVDYLILSKGCVDLFSPKTIRASMGALFHIPIVVDEEIEKITQSLQAMNVKLYVTEVEKAKEVFQVSFKGKAALVIGNEGNGASSYIKQQADERVYIPMPGGLESLNASIAASICMYEAMKQRQF